MRKHLGIAALFLICAHCSSPKTFTLQIDAPKSNLDQGGKGIVNVHAFSRTSDNGSPSPVSGTVALTVNQNGSIDPGSVTLDSNGSGAAVFTMCASGSTCIPGALALVEGTLSTNGQTVRGGTVFLLNGTPPVIDDGGTDDAGSDGGSADGGVDGGADAGTPTASVKLDLFLATGEPFNAARAPMSGDPLLVRATVTDANTKAPLTGVAVLFEATNGIGVFSVHASADAGTSDAGTASLSITSDNSGFATALFAPGDTQTAGAMRVTSLGVVAALPFTIVGPGVLSFTPGATDNFQHVMGVKSSGWREVNLMRFQLLDTTGLPYLGKATVTFNMPQTSGATLSPTTATINANGEVLTAINSGYGAGTVSVTATTTVNTIKLTTQSDTVAIVGAKANGRNLAVKCDRYALPALVGNDCSFMRSDYTVNCTAVLGDRFNNTLGRSTRVFWQSEAGLFGPPSLTPDASPDVDPVSQAGLGRTTNSLRTLNTRLPSDVTPFSGEPSIVGSLSDPCLSGNTARTFNPRDGLVTFIAYTQGEEGFIDLNANGQYDLGEPFFDQGEPFIDANDNDVWDPGETFIDINGDSVYNGPNGKWDADTTIWTTGHVVVTGNPTATWVPAPIILPASAGATLPFNVRWSDANLNEPAPFFSNYSLAMGSGTGGVSLLSFPTFSDHFSSMGVFQTTLCDQTTNICRLQTRFTFDQSPEVFGLYTAPGAAPFSGTIRSLVQQDALTLASDSSSAQGNGGGVVGGNDAGVSDGGASDAGSADGGAGDGGSDGGTVLQSVNVQVDLLLATGEVTAARRAVLSGDPLTVRATVTDKVTGVPAPNASVLFETTNGIGNYNVGTNGGGGAASATVVTGGNGVSTTVFTPSAAQTSGVIRVTVNGNVSSLNFAIVGPGQLSFTPGGTDNFVHVMGVTSSGFNEQNVVRFRLVDTSGLPYNGNATVTFTMPTTSGASISPSSVIVDANGEAVTTVHSGVGVGSAAVTAKTTIGSLTLTTQSDTIAIVGAKANGRNFAVSCSRYALPGLVGNDCSFMRADYTVNCTAVLGDRFNNTLGVSTRVLWESEAGLFGPPSFTPLASPDSDPVSQVGLGRTQNSLRTLNSRLPLDVTPISGEPSVAGSLSDPCLTGSTVRTFNPRDGLVTFIAYTQGEEGFIDQNNNGKYDSGEPFFDQGEPYIDANDNDTYDAGETFIDVNGDGVHNGPNGTWDANTTIWTTGHIVMTGGPSATWSPQPIALPQVASATRNFTIRWADENLNEPSPSFTTYSLSMLSGTGIIQLLSPSSYADHFSSMGVYQVTSCNSSNVCSLLTHFTYDQSAEVSGFYTAPSAAPFSGLVGAACLQDSITSNSSNQ